MTPILALAAVALIRWSLREQIATAGNLAALVALGVVLG